MSLFFVFLFLFFVFSQADKKVVPARGWTLDYFHPPSLPIRRLTWERIILRLEEVLVPFTHFLSFFLFSFFFVEKK